MATNWDDFTVADAAPSSSVDWSQFTPAAPAAPKQNKGTLGDLGTDLKRGIEGLPGLVTGIADIPAGLVGLNRPADRAANALGELTGFRPSQWAKDAAQEYSPNRQAANRDIAQAWDTGGALDIASAYARNPGATVGNIVESVPGMAAGGVIGKGLAVAGKVAPMLAGAVGEGTITAGSAMDQTDRAADPTKAALSSVAAGAGTAAIGLGAGKVASKFGLTDVDELMAGGKNVAKVDAAGKLVKPMGLPKRVAASMAQEGLLEELPQSMQEQAWQNVAEDKPIGEGVARAGVEGALAGAAMGGGMNLKGPNTAYATAISKAQDTIADHNAPFAERQKALDFLKDWKENNHDAAVATEWYQGIQESLIQDQMARDREQAAAAPVDMLAYGGLIVPKRKGDGEQIGLNTTEEVADEWRGPKAQQDEEAPGASTTVGGFGIGENTVKTESLYGTGGVAKGTVRPITATEPVDMLNTNYGGLTLGKREKGDREQIPLPPVTADAPVGSGAGVGANQISTANPYGNGSSVSGTVRPTQETAPAPKAAAKTAPAAAPAAFTPTPAEAQLAQDTAPTVAPVTPEQRLQEQSNVGAVAPSATAVPAVRLPKNVQLTDKQKPVFEYIQRAMENNQQDEIVDAEGVLQYQKIADKFGIARGSAKSFVDRIAQKMAVAAGKSLAEMKTALRERAVATRTVAPSDMDTRGLSPAMQTAEVNENDLFGSEDGAEQSMGVINSVGGSQGEIGKDEQLPASYVDSVAPSDKAKADAEANRKAAQAEDDALLTSDAAKTAMLDWDDAKSADSPSFSALAPATKAEYVREYVRQIEHDDSWGSIESHQRDFERRLEPSDVVRRNERPEIAGKGSDAQEGTRRLGNEESPSEPGARNAIESGPRGKIVSATPRDSGDASERAGDGGKEGSQETPTNPLEARLAKLQDFLGGKQKGAVKRLIDRYTNGDITLERLVGELENYEQQVKDGVRFSESNEGGADAAKVTASLKKLFFSPEKFDKLVRVVQSVSDLQGFAATQLSRAKDPTKVQGFVGTDGKVVLISDNIQPGQELAVFLHEVGVHLGMEKLIGRGNMVQLSRQIAKWSVKNDGSPESVLAKKALDRAKSSSSTNKAEEVLAYFIEEAVNSGIDPVAVSKAQGELASWFRTLWAAAKTALRKLGLNRFESLTAQDMVNLAYGAAKLEMTGTWHGTAADFRNFNHEFMGKGEGMQAFGWGSYLAQAPGIGYTYWKQDTQRKATVPTYSVGDTIKTGPFAGLDVLAVDGEKVQIDIFGLKWVTPSAEPDGSLMRVDTAVADDEFLDWDKPMSEQSEVVKAALEDAGYGQKAFGKAGAMGHVVYKTMEGNLGSDKAASEYLDSIGIKGIRFLDANSRSGPDLALLQRTLADAQEELATTTDDARKADLQVEINEIEDEIALAEKKTSNLVIFNDKNIQRVMTEVGADTDRIKFGEALSPLSEAVAKWKQVVRDWLAEKIDRTTRPVVFDSTPAVLQAIGLPDLRILASGAHFIEDSLYNHGVKASQLGEVVRDIADPVAMFWVKESNGDHSLNILTRQYAGGGQLVVGLKPVVGSRTETAHMAATVFARSTNKVANYAREGQMVYQGDTSAMPAELVTAIAEGKKRFGQTAVDLSSVLAGRFSSDTRGLNPVEAARDGVARTGKIMYRSDAVKLIENGTAKFSEASTPVREYASKVGGRTARMLVDDAVGKVAKLSDSLSFLYDLVEKYKAKLPAIEQWYKGVQASVSTRKQFEGMAEAIASSAGDLPNGTKAINAFLAESTKDQKWGYDPKFANRKVTVDSGMAAKFARLSKEEQNVVRDVFAHGEKMGLLQYEIVKALGIDSEFTSTGKLDGPYAPLKRFGDHIALLKSKELIEAEKAEDTKRVAELKKDPAHYEMSQFDTRGQARAHADDNAGKWFFTDSFEKSKRITKERMPADVLQKVLSAVKMSDTNEVPAVAREAMTKLVTEMYFQSLDEHNARTSGMKRKNMAGFDDDMMRSFLAHARAQAGFLANMKHGGEINDAFYQMQQDARNKDTRHRDGQDALNTIAEHYAENLNYTETPWQDRLMAGTSAWQLATSVGYHLNNMMQPAMVTVPQLAADFNDYRGAWKQIAKGYATLKETGISDLKLENVKNEGLRAALQAVSDAGLLDVGMMEDLTQFESTHTGIAGVDKTTEVARKALHLLRKASRFFETMNRVSSATAAYNMAIAVNKSQAEAQAYAVNIVRRTQGDASRVNKPMILKKLPKIMGQYKGYQFMMAAAYSKAFQQAFMSADPTTKAIGRRMLAYKLFHTTMAAGALGLPTMNLVALAFAGMGGGDEPEDLERTLREKIGDPALAQLLLHGPLAYFGMDMSAKLGDDKIFSILPYADVDLSSAAGLTKTAAGAMGPAFSQAGKFADGVGLMKRGEYYKGMEKFLPKGVESGMKAFRIANEGFTLKNGDLMFRPEDINSYALALDALGLPSAELKHMDWLRGQQYEIKRFYVDRTKELEQEYSKAAKGGDSTTMTELRQDWMDLQSGKDHMRQYFGDVHAELKRQPLSNLMRYPQTTAKRERKLQRAAQTE